MFKQASITALCFAVAVMTGCSDKPEERAAKTSDGTDTFVYKPAVKSGAAVDSVSTAASGTTPAITKSADAAETFQYKPNAALFPNANKAEKK